MHKLIHLSVLWFLSGFSHANNPQYEQLTASTQTVIFHGTSDQAVSYTEYAAVADNIAWLVSMSRRLEKYIPDSLEREEFLRTVFYEATRAGLDPQIVLSIIQVESGFKKYAVSHAGARGYMQVMPFWVGVIGHQDHNLFHLRVNLR
ncbi:MAG: transglycosylase SLT domain-containing protein, partial [Betaproteobacteria bacterium]|nr:transglycosylase SLT domain-containing protein [Betaproteobacteria bacterium]